VPCPHYVRARHYSKTSGTWTTVDPLWPTELAFTYSDARSTFGVDFLGTGCVECAAETYLRWRQEWFHKEGYNSFAHCLNCCVLAVLFSPECAMASQIAQAQTPPRNIDPPDRQMLRYIPCSYGIEFAKGISPGQATSKCADKCWNAYYKQPNQTDPVKPSKPPKPPKPLPRTNPPGCFSTMKACYIDFKNSRDAEIDKIMKEGANPGGDRWWDK
jgi:hypothetical protein